MKDLQLRRFAFEMERIGLQHRVANSSLEMFEDVQRRELIIDMHRRLAVRREMFENPDNPPVVTRKHETVELSAEWPASWWDHAKAEVGFLRWLVVRHVLKPIDMAGVQECRRIETSRTEKHYVQHVTVLDDAKEIPAHQRTIEFQFAPEATLEGPPQNTWGGH
tara:strand:+ start:3452 stop:3943 length:492 start_codon:yes stop_codon:yes gene_type:complete